MNMCCLFYISLQKKALQRIQPICTIGTKFTWIVPIKIFTISLPSQLFLANGHHFEFHIFFPNGLFRATQFSLQLGCFGLEFIYFCNDCHHKCLLLLILPLFLSIGINVYIYLYIYIWICDWIYENLTQSRKPKLTVQAYDYNV